MIWNQTQNSPINRLLWTRFRDDRSISGRIVQNLSPQLQTFALIRRLRHQMSLSRGEVDLFEHFFRCFIALDQFLITSMDLGSCFFHQNSPNLVLMRFREQRISVLINWHVIINQDLLNLVLDSQQNLVETVWIVNLIAKNALDSLGSLCQSCKSCEICFVRMWWLYCTLKLQGLAEDDRVFNYLRNSCPLVGCDILQNSQALVVGRERKVCPFFILFAILLCDCGVIGLCDFYNGGVWGRQCIFTDFVQSFMETYHRLFIIISRCHLVSASTFDLFTATEQIHFSFRKFRFIILPHLQSNFNFNQPIFLFYERLYFLNP